MCETAIELYKLLGLLSKYIGAKRTKAQCSVQVGQTRTCFNFVADRWYPVANTSIDHLIKIQEYAETGTVTFVQITFLQFMRYMYVEFQD